LDILKGTVVETNSFWTEWKMERSLTSTSAQQLRLTRGISCKLAGNISCSMSRQGIVHFFIIQMGKKLISWRTNSVKLFMENYCCKISPY